MAKALGVPGLLGVVAAFALAVAFGSVAAQDDPSIDSRRLGPVYKGPGALVDPADPFQSLRWIFGITTAPRNRITGTRRELQARLDYDLEREVVLLSYYAGTQEILPPMSLSQEAYVEYAFEREVRRAWIDGNRRVLAENQGGGSEGLVNLSLPFEIPFTEKVFGSGAPNLRVSGREQITFSGTSSWVVGQVTGERGGGSLFPKLDMRQQLNVNLQGTIGSKLFIDVAQNSEALTPLENSIKIRYKGDEDEIVKSVELGNTNLSLPSTQFISFSTRQEGLFGVKADAQVGNVGITAIASRQEGESGQATLVGGAKEQVQTRQDWEYVAGKYFFVSDPDEAPVPNIPPGNLRVYLDDRDFRNDVELGAQATKVWIDPNAGTPEEGPYTGNFHLLVEEQDYFFYNNENFTQPILILRGQMSADHVLAVAYRQVIAPGDTLDVGTWTAGGITPEGGVQLKMIRPNEETWGTQDLPSSIWSATRRLEMRNFYSLGARNIDRTSFELRVVRDIGGNNPSDLTRDGGAQRTPYIQVLGLDQRNNEDASNFTPDGFVDPEFIDYTEGVIWFPDLRPFDPSLVDLEGNQYRARAWPIPDELDRPDALGWRLVGGQYEPAPETERLEETVPQLYDLRTDVLSRDHAQYHKYTLEATFKTAVNTIQLGTIGNILEGSETVRLNGEVLSRGTDYTIFYDTGTINLLNPDATAPGADLVVSYSYDALFSRGSRSLLGASLGTLGGPNSRYSFSTSWLHESRGVPDRRPRLGQEPSKTTLGDLSGQIRLPSWKLTELVDALPLVNTIVPSRLDLSAAMGISFPNPNTRGEVYVDDMEGAELVTSAGVNRFSWSLSSPPVRALRIEGDVREDITPQPVDRGQLLWFSPSTVQVGDITPGADTRDEREDIVPVLEVIYIPQENPMGPSGSWGGLVSSLSPTGVDISASQYIDVWINDYQNFADPGALRRGELFLDIGTVSEDAVWDPLTPPLPPNGELDFEDKNFSGGQVEYSEDTGLDGVKNPGEPADDRDRFTPIPASQDPAGDDRIEEIKTGLKEETLRQRLDKYLGINGTEANQQPDTEDLNGDMRLQITNDYVEFRIDLADSAFSDLGRDYPQYGIPGNGWRLYRIPLDEFHLQQGIPDLSTVRHMRMWFRGIEPGDTLDVQIASIDIVGNRWEVGREVELCPQELFNVAVVNNKDNADYQAPFEVERINNIKEREQSISLEFENMRNRNELIAFRALPDVKDYTNYQTVGYYVNPRLETLASTDSLEFFVRFGSDSNSDTLAYYEIATTLREDDPRLSADGWLDLRINIADLSSIKIDAPSGTSPDSFLVGGPFLVSGCDDVIIEPEPPPGSGGLPWPPGRPGDDYVRYGYGTANASGQEYLPPLEIGNGLRVTVRGTPSMSRVRRLSVGLRNVTGHGLSRGRVWFDEIRMGDVRRDTGVATRAALNLVLADFASLQGSVSLTDADFMRLGQTRGSGNQDLAYNLGTQINLGKFTERIWLQAPFKVGLKKSVRTPKFRPNSDIIFDGVDTGRDITESAQRDMSLSLAREPRGPTSPLLRYTIDSMAFSGSWLKTYNNGVTQLDSTRTVSGSARYNLNVGHIPPLTLLGRVPLWLWPRSFQASLNGGKSVRRIWSKDERDARLLTLTNSSDVRTGVLQLNTNFQPIRVLTLGWASTRDLIDSHFGPDSSIVRLQNPSLTVFGLNLGRETRQSNNVNFNFTPPLAQSFRPRFTWTGTFNANKDPNLTRADFDSTVTDVSNNNNASFSLTVPLGQAMKKLFGGSAGGAGGAQRPSVPDERADNYHRARMGDVTAAHADSADAASEEGEEEGDDGPSTGERIRALFTRYIVLGDIQGSVNFGKRNTVTGVYGEPPLPYRLALSRDVGLGADVHSVQGASFNQTFGENATYRGNTRLSFIGGLAMDLSYQKRADKQRTNSGVGRVEDETTWPEIRFDWGRIQEKLPLVNKMFSDFRAVSTTYSKNTRDTGTQLNPKESTTINTSWRPLISINGTLRGQWRTTLSVEKTSSSTLSRREGSAAMTNTRSNVTYRLTLAKKLSIGGGEGRGRDLDLNIDGSYNKQSSITESSAGVIPPTIQENDNLQIRTSASIRFTRTVTGTFGLNLGQQRNVTANFTRRSVGISFTTGFNF